MTFRDIGIPNRVVQKWDDNVKTKMDLLLFS